MCAADPHRWPARGVLGLATGTALLTAAAVVLLTASAAPAEPSAGRVPPAVAAAPAGPAPAAQEAADGRSRPADPRPAPPAWSPPAPGAAPTALSFQGRSAPVDAVAVGPGGALQVPADGSRVGWWAAGPAPGAATGTVVVTGHVDTWDRGPGVLSRARDLRPGDEVAVTTGAGTVRYVVQALRSYPKASLPREVFTPYGLPRLVLLTCGGAFDERTRHYADNVVVYAVPA